MTARELIESQFGHLELYLTRYDQDLFGIQEEIFAVLLKLIDNLPQKNGRFLREEDIKREILKFDRAIAEIFEKGSYSKLYNSIFPNLDALAQIQQEMSAFVNPDLREQIFKAELSSIKKGYIQKIAAGLGNKAALGINITGPLKSILFEYAVNGLSVQEAKEKLFDVAIASPNGGRLKSYASQIARDALFQYTGSVDKSIGDFIGAKDVNYLGNIIRDSRLQCIRWIEKFNGFIPANKLQSEINWAKKNGQGYSKYLPELTIDSFALVRGGHNCRHRVVYTNGNSTEIQNRINKIEKEYERINKKYEANEVKKLDAYSLELYQKNLQRIKK